MNYRQLVLHVNNQKRNFSRWEKFKLLFVKKEVGVFQTHRITFKRLNEKIFITEMKDKRTGRTL